MTNSTSDFGLASEILQDELRRTYFGVYCPGPGVSLDRFMIHSVSDLGLAMLNLPPPGPDHLPDAEHVTAVRGRRWFLFFSRAAKRFRKEVSDARLGFCLPTGDRPARRGVVLLDRGVVLLEPRLDRGVPVEGRRFLMGETESWGALWVLVALAMTLAASWVSVIGGRLAAGYYYIIF